MTSVRYSSPCALSVVTLASRRTRSAGAKQYMPELTSSTLNSASDASLCSTMRWTDCASSRITRPYPAGSLMRAVSTVARAWLLRCVCSKFCNVVPVSRGVSPVSTTTGASPRLMPRESRSAIATRTAWPVPDCVSCTTVSAHGAISCTCATTASRPCPTTTTTCSGSRAAAASSTWPSNERPATWWRTLGVAECMRLPSPAARMNTAEGRVTTQERICLVGARTASLRFRRQPSTKSHTHR